VFPRELERRMGDKLGLAQPTEADRSLVEDVLQLLAAERVDYPIFWQRLTRHVAGAPADSVRDLFIDRAGFDAWLARYTQRLAQQGGDPAARMRLANPRFVLRNHLGELAIRQAREGDFSGVAELASVLQSPFAEHPQRVEAFTGFPPDWASSIEISCSS
jgi:uncharacterized protein YdiU (UPF0061 family)